MKNIYATIAVIFLCYSANSQIKAGQVLLGGNASYAYETVKLDGATYKFSELSLSPSAGIFIVDKLAGGLRVTLSAHRTRHVNRETDYKTHSRTYSPFVRYYLLPAAKDYNLFLETSLDYQAEAVTSNGVKKKKRSDGFSVAGGPVVFLSPQIALELALSYGRQYREEEHTTSLGTSLGFQFHFGKKNSR